VYAASVEGLSPDERAAFDEALIAPPQRRRPRALPLGPDQRPALRSVPSPERFSADRLATIRALGGDIEMGA
jgi:hypothetical protein